MNALSVARPWAQLIVAGLKTAENRRFRPPRTTVCRDGGWLIVHASAAWREDALELARFALGRDVRRSLEVDHTGYIGVVRVVGYCEDATRVEERCGCGPWSVPGFRHWRLTDAAAFPEPMPGPGRLGVWPAPQPAVAAAARIIGRHGEVAGGG